MKRIKSLIKTFLLNFYKNKGVEIGENTEIMGFPKFGPEPYLIKLGENVTISSNVTFLTHDGATRVLNYGEKKYMKFGYIIIDNNCFIGANAILMPGIHIGENAIIGAGSVVTKDVPMNAIVAGNPAKVISNIQKFEDKMNSLELKLDYKKMKLNKKEYLIKHVMKS
ncbi:acyltransferase [Halalkalibacillus halophilus]|uniref:acyltransferase n=1 Tax=Halalkalibacillus halophilus TaxID=392827 RepID=UPI000400BA9A|nr:acyltransferase [Halalkalibacillus halophilus]